jgi:zinc protease
VRPAQISDTVLAYGSVRTSASVQEPAGKEGVSIVLNDVRVRYAISRDRRTFQRAQDDLDTQLGGGFQFGMQTTSASFDRAVALLAEEELHPRFDAQTFEAARRRRSGSWKRRSTAPARSRTSS